MSASRDDLPAAPEPKPPALSEVVWAAARWVVGQELLMRIVLVAVLVGLGVAGLAFAQDKFDAGLEPHEARITALEKGREEDRAALATTRMQSAETMLNVRLIVEALKLRPIVLVEQPKDAGP